MSVSCGAYVCGNAGACKSSCTSNADCDSPSVCNAGACGGLRGEYYDNIDFTGTKVTRTDPVVDFDWGTGSPDPALDVDSFSVRWTGKVTPLYSETYTFYTSADDGTILWVNGIEIVDNWSDHPESESAGTITLTANRPYDIRLDYYDHFSDAAAHLLWSSPSQAKQIIPASQLRP